MMHTIVYGSKKIDFTLLYADRKTLGITVKPDMTVWANAPINSDVEKIKAKISKKAPWILKQLLHFQSFYPRTVDRKYVSGESHLYMGRQYRLKIIKGDDYVKLKGQFLEVFTNDKSKVKKLLHEWYLYHAQKRIFDIAEPIINRFKIQGVCPQKIILKPMTKRWGSCTAKGKIILNPDLIKAPKICIEYVIIHEMCHLIHPNHTTKFYSLLSQEMKDWVIYKTKLEKLLA